jgi:ribonucleoside-diphosphate reductase alpha chain
VVFDSDDEEMMNAKTGNWIEENPQRARSNNSILFLRKKVTEESFKEVLEKSKEFGEPGFIFADHEDTLSNPCREIGFVPVTKDGRCGVQFCNLTSINGAKTHSLKEFREHTRAASLIGTLQAGYTNFHYLSNASRELTEEEALLGVSITGIMDNPKVLLNPKNQRECSDIAVLTNEEWAKKIKVKPAARVTCVKPEGTSSLVLGSASGIHPHHSRKYFRRVQCNKIDNVYQYFRLFNNKLCEESVWSANKTDDVVTFPIEITNGALTKKDLNAIKHLDHIKSTQENWVLPGTTKHNKKKTTHSVSCTVLVKEKEWEEVAKYLFDNKEFFAAVSLLSITGDKDFKQAPMEDVSSEKESEAFDKLLSSMSRIDYTQLEEVNDETNLQQQLACAGGNCEIN